MKTINIELTAEELRNLEHAVFQESLRWSDMALDSGCPIERRIGRNYSELWHKIKKIRP